jgi:hypothetical protein
MNPEKNETLLHHSLDCDLSLLSEVSKQFLRYTQDTSIYIKK